RCRIRCAKHWLTLPHPETRIRLFQRPNHTPDVGTTLLQRIGRFSLLLIVSWCVMTTTHEIGHLLGGFSCGATLTDFDLAPWRMPYSLHEPDPHPLVTLWMGPIFGVAAPLFLAMMLQRRWTWFVADFCLLANGIYLALAWVTGDPFLDTPRLLQAGSPTVLVFAYCAIAIGFGYIRFRTDAIESLGPQPSRSTKEANVASSPQATNTD
ncbi:MAG: hypothetical protein AAF989_13185, partial [Planctomycetota bacterium]